MQSSRELTSIHQSKTMTEFENLSAASCKMIPDNICKEIEICIRNNQWFPKTSSPISKMERLETLTAQYRDYDDAPTYYATMIQLILANWERSSETDYTLQKIKILLDAGADPNYMGEEYYKKHLDIRSDDSWFDEKLNRTPLMIVCSLSRKEHIDPIKYEILDLLLKYGANINATCECFYDCVRLRHNALYFVRKDVELLRFLLENGIDYRPFMQDIVFRLVYNYDSSDYDTIIKMFIDIAGLDINEMLYYTRTDGRRMETTMLYECFGNEHIDWFKDIINRCDLADVLINNGARITPEIVALYESKLETYHMCCTDQNEIEKYDGMSLQECFKAYAKCENGFYKSLTIVTFLRPHIEEYYRQQQMFKRAHLDEDEDEDA